MDWRMQRSQQEFVAVMIGRGVIFVFDGILKKNNPSPSAGMTSIFKQHCLAITRTRTAYDEATEHDILQSK
jgi:hypothetical protein